MVHLTCHLPTTPERFPARPQRKALQDLRKHSASHPPPPLPTRGHDGSTLSLSFLTPFHSTLSPSNLRGD